MVKASIMPIFNNDMTILLKFCSFLSFFYVFRSQNSCSQKNHVHKLFKEKNEIFHLVKYFGIAFYQLHFYTTKTRVCGYVRSEFIH